MNWEYESPLDEGCPILGLKEALAQKSNSDGPFFQELWGLLGDEGQKGLMKSFGEAERQQKAKKEWNLKIKTGSQSAGLLLDRLRLWQG